ncbi:hypothetical protein L6164_022166 [Bauhinia variegata]|uniref:Uncharacterized protein n=1 Tax=Bauhinia variegata TaxID=167791 RepID=A0ACB9MG44_BAUVA|nr:hypothetical protein L6164_022166 [Bauhinia variegata]
MMMASSFSCALGCLRALPEKSWAKIANLANKTKKLGQDDPRRVTHSLKVGLALTLVSMFFYFRALYDDFGANSIWAVMTVVVVMEFSVGAIMTFMRFVPGVKARYDYGFSIFILTFCFVSISGYRDDQILEFACKRVLTIIIGSFIAMVVCICVYPVWIGEDLHNLVADKLEKLAKFLQGFANDYFNASENGQGQTKTDKSFAEQYESVLTSKSKEETMANLARWEFGHGQFRFRHPWRQYLKVGNLTWQCAYKLEALDFYLKSETQTPLKLRMKIKDACQCTSSESGQALKEITSAVKSMTCSPKAKAHIALAKGGVESLNSILRSNPWEGVALLEIVPVAAVVSLLTEVVTCVERISEAIDELASLAHFKTAATTTTKPVLLPLLHEGIMKPISASDESQYHNTVDGSTSPNLPKENGSSSIVVVVQ